MKEARELENKEQTARKKLENSRTRSKPLEREVRELRKTTRELENKEQTARKELEY